MLPEDLKTKKVSQTQQVEENIDVHETEISPESEAVNENDELSALPEIEEPEASKLDTRTLQHSEETVNVQMQDLVAEKVTEDAPASPKDEIAPGASEETANSPEDKIIAEESRNSVQADIAAVIAEGRMDMMKAESDAITDVTEETKDEMEKDDVVEEEQEKEVGGVMKETISRASQDEEILTVQYDAFEDDMRQREDEQSQAASSFVLLEDDDEDKEKANEESPTVVEKKKRKSVKSLKSIKSTVSRQASTQPNSAFLTSKLSVTTSSMESHLVGSPRKSSVLSRATQVEEAKEEEEDDEEVDEEEEEEEEEGEEQMTEYARYQYYQKYDEMCKQYQDELNKNALLIKKLAIYYQKKKMFHVLHEGKPPADAQKKYEKQLDDYERIIQRKSKEHEEIENLIKDLRQKCMTKEEEAGIYFERLQQYEREVGKSIINSESGRNYGEKLIDRYLKRQKIQLNNLKKIRLDYVKMRNRVTETQEALDAIDNLGPDLHLIDYEQLKLDNRNLLDKLEDKEAELLTVRTRCQNVVQTLAHRREKSAALQTDLTFLKATLANVTGEYEDVREHLNVLKVERDRYRNEIEKMKKEAGLLSKPKLLKDMSDTIDEGKLLTETLECIKEEHSILASKVKSIRRNKRSKARMKMIQERMRRGDESRDPSTLDSGSILDFDI